MTLYRHTLSIPVRSLSGIPEKARKQLCQRATQNGWGVIIENSMDVYGINVAAGEDPRKARLFFYVYSFLSPEDMQERLDERSQIHKTLAFSAEELAESEIREYFKHRYLEELPPFDELSDIDRAEISSTILYALGFFDAFERVIYDKVRAERGRS